jgi:hypothetical protein
MQAIIAPFPRRLSRHLLIGAAFKDPFIAGDNLFQHVQGIDNAINFNV